ncbi:hypothetical protein [Musicola keenii]|uniref:hypothetical protein n=1 Tax=Musicola keenii TaxID=2884250 RepID=UPI00177C7A1A|nr:hypothetical protein [Musicola keenii]
MFNVINTENLPCKAATSSQRPSGATAYTTEYNQFIALPASIFMCNAAIFSPLAKSYIHQQNKNPIKKIKKE